MRKLWLLLVAVLLVCLLAIPAAAETCDGSHAGTDLYAQNGGSVTLTTGSYYLSEDTAVSVTVDSAATVTICLNGHAWTNGDSTRPLTVKGGAKVYIVDCSTTAGTITGVDLTKGGTVSDTTAGTIYVTGTSSQVHMYDITVQNGRAKTGGNIRVDASAAFFQHSGTVTNGIAYGSGATGGNISVQGSYTMHDGFITGGLISVDGAGNVDVRGTFSMTGGTISNGRRWYDSNNTYQVTEKANFFVVNGTLDLSGGQIFGATMVYGANGKLKISNSGVLNSGDASTPSLSLLSNATIVPYGQLTTAMVVCSSKENTLLVATDASHALKAHLSSSTGLCVAMEADGKLYLKNYSHTHCSKLCSTNSTHIADCTGYDLPYTQWNGEAIDTAGYYCLDSNLSISTAANIKAKNVNLLINGTLTASAQALILNSADVILKGSGTIQGHGGNGISGGVVRVDNSTLLIDGVTLQRVENSTVTSTNGGILYAGGNAIITMDSGTIRGGSASGGGNVFINGGSFILKGGTIQSGTASNGGNVYAYTGSFTQNGGTIELGTATGTGGGNLCVYNAAVSLCGGVISQGSAGNGGNVYTVEKGTGNITHKGGTIQNGTATSGGNVYVHSNGTYTMSDDGDESTVPVISGGHATGNGTAGNLHIPTGKTFTMECGRIENGHVAKDGPGNIYVLGTLNISGGFISGGYRDNNVNNEVKRNIFVYQGTINMSGGTIDGGVMLHLENSKLNISGSARIASTGKLALTANGAVLAIDVATLNNDAYLQLSGTNSNGAIVLDTKVATGPNGTALKASSKQQLFALFGANTSGLFNLGSSTYQLTLESNGSVYLRGGSIHAHCICAGTTTHATGCDGYDRIFQGTTAMPKASNAYYFTKDSDIGQVLLGSSDGSTNVDTVICLNDCTITSSARMALIWGGSSLTLTDCGSNGQVLSSAATASNGGLIHTAANSVFNLYNGTLNAEGLKNQSSGGAIDNAGTLNIYGGSIIGGSAINGGAINNIGTILMSGGSITSGTASASGACIYFSKGSISLSGSPQIDEICIPSGKTISIAETLGAETSVGILCAGLAAGELRSFMDTPASTLAQAQQWSSCFHGTDDSVVVIGEGNNLLLSKTPTGVSLNGGSTYYTMAVATQVVKQSDRMTLHTNHTGDITLSEGAYLDLNGKVLDGSVSVNAGTLYLMDSANADYTYEGGKVTGNITGNVARHFTTNTLSNYGHNYRFLVIQTDAGYSSHRIYLAVKSTVFSPKRFAVNFRTAFKCDSMLADYVNAYGVEATGKTTADPSNYLDNSELVPGNSTANERITQLTNMMQPGMSAAVLENRATTPLQINAYITLTDKLATSADMSNIRSAVVVRTYKSTIEDIDKMELTDSQKTYLGEMYNTYSVVDGTEFMAAWNLSKIPGYAAAIVQEP